VLGRPSEAYVGCASLRDQNNIRSCTRRGSWDSCVQSSDSKPSELVRKQLWASIESAYHPL